MRSEVVKGKRRNVRKREEGKRFINHKQLKAQNKEKDMPELEFYDVKSKSKFKTTEFQVRTKAGRNFAVAKAKSGPHECWRVLSKDQAAKLK